MAYVVDIVLFLLTKCYNVVSQNCVALHLTRYGNVVG